MATYTSKLNLKKPLGTEHVSRQDMNDNYDKIDAGVVTNVDGEISNSLLIGTRSSQLSTIGQYSIAHGTDVAATGKSSYACGRGPIATAEASHAEGSYTNATGFAGHAEGHMTFASGQGSHAEGTGTHATKNYSHAEGYETIASANAQHVGGKYNVEDTSYSAQKLFGTYAEIIGNGTGTTGGRSNARALDWDGNEYLMGDLYVGCDADSTGGEKVTTDPFTGATSAAAGSKGYVPAPSAGDQTKFLRADGTWGNVDGASDMIGATASTAGEHGLVPAPAAGDQTKFLSGAGTWEPVGGASDMTGATASTAGVHGLVPAPAAGDQNKVLKGDGTWGVMQETDMTPLQEGLAIIVDGDTCTTAVPVGGYAYIKNNTHSLPEGLYKNTSASAFPVSGGTADSTVFTAVSSVLNAISLPEEITYTKNTSVYSSGDISAYRIGKIVYISFDSVKTKAAGTNMIIASGFPIPAGGVRAFGPLCVPWASDLNSKYQIYIETTGEIKVNNKSASTSMNTQVSYICE